MLTQDAWSGVGHVRMKMGADGGRAVREVFCRTKPMMLSRLFSWFPRHIVPCTSGRWCRGNFRKKPMAIPLVDLRLGHNRLAQSLKENCPIQDDPERRIGFQYKMILKTGGILRVNDHPNGECRRPELRGWKPCWKPARRCGSPQKGERR